jgi:hypothetical protein
MEGTQSGTPLTPLLMASYETFGTFVRFDRKSGRKEPVPAEVGNSYLNSNANAGEARELLAGYRSYSAVGPTSGKEIGSSSVLVNAS